MKKSPLNAFFSLYLLSILLVLSFVVQAQADSTWTIQVVDPAGAGGSIALDSEGYPHIAYTYWYVEDDSSATHLNYAVWNGTDWKIQTVDSSGGGGLLALDSYNTPHIVYSVGSGRVLKYATLSNQQWKIQTIETSRYYRGLHYSFTLDSNGNPHIVYDSFNETSKSREVKYAVLTGSTWDIQTIDTVNYTAGYISQPSIVLDGNNKPHIIYLNPIEFPTPIQTQLMSFYVTYDVKYASLINSKWLVQTIVMNSTSTGNLVLDSRGQPSFCCSQIYFVRHAFYFEAVTSTSYMSFNGHSWLNQTIDSNPIPTMLTYLRIDANDNPQIFFPTINDQEPDSISLKCARRNYSGWYIEDFGSFPLNHNYYVGSWDVKDITLDSKGNPNLIISGQVGTIRSAPFYGDLRYGTLEGTPIPISTTLLTLIIVVTAIVIGIVLLICFKKRKR